MKFRYVLIEDLQVYKVPITHDASIWYLLRRVVPALIMKPGFACAFSYRLNVILAKRSVFLARLFAVMRAYQFACDISFSARIGPGFRVCHPFNIVIGDQTVIGSHFTIYNGVTLGAKHFDKPHLKPIIGNGVTIGTGAKVLGDIEIGDGATIGALTFCDKSVPAGATAYGNPMAIKNGP